MKHMYFWVLCTLLAFPARAQVFYSDHIYRIVNRSSQLPLDVTGGSYDDNVPIQLYAENATAAQQWTLYQVAGTVNGLPTYNITNRGSRRGMASATEADGSPVRQGGSSSGAGYQWLIQERTPGVPTDGYVIRTYFYSRALSVVNGDPAAGAHIEIQPYAQQSWQTWDIIDITSEFRQGPVGLRGTIGLLNNYSQKRLEVNNATSTTGEPIQQWQDVHQTHQQWYLTPTAYPDYYHIVNRNSGMALEIENDSPFNGALAQQNFPNNNYGQCWRFNPVSGGYVLTNLYGKVLEIDGSSTTNGARAQQWDRDANAPGQVWQVSNFIGLNRSVPASASPTAGLPDALAEATVHPAALVGASAPLTLYPNPARHILTLSLSLRSLTSIAVTDMQGRRVVVPALNDGQLDVSALAPGVYLLQTQDAQRVYRQKFSKE